jgi:hypothetical protein
VEGADMIFNNTVNGFSFSTNEMHDSANDVNLTLICPHRLCTHPTVI